MRASLKKTEILRGYRSFSAVLSRGEVAHSGIIRCFFILGDKEGVGAKAGFAVARGFAGATKRNRLRRLMREAYRANKSVLLAEGSQFAQRGIRMVFLCVPRAAENTPQITFQQIERHIVALLNNVRQRLL